MQTADTSPARLAGILRDTLAWENHCCMDFGDMDQSLSMLARYRAAGVRLLHLNVGDSAYPFETICNILARVRHWLRARPDEYVLVATIDDALRAKREDKLGVCFDVEGAFSVGEDLTRISLYYDLGVRWMAMAYNRRNLVGAGVHDEVDHGLTVFGRQLCAEMDRVGMIKDVAHTGYRTALDVCAGSPLPVTISHSNPRRLTDHPRCVPDEVMRACAATGGVMGISGVGLFLGDNDISAENMVRSIDYAVDLLGIDHVGIGTDFVMMRSGSLENLLAADAYHWPPGFGYEGQVPIAPPERFIEVPELLLRRGYDDAAVAKILGGNFLRVARQVWK
jgi:membrane dipeptidase